MGKKKQTNQGKAREKRAPSPPPPSPSPSVPTVVAGSGNAGQYQMLFAILVLVTCGVISYGAPRIFGKSVTVTAQESDERILASAPTATPQDRSCEDRFRSMLPFLGTSDEHAVRSLPVALHRNGEPTPCGESTVGAVLDELETHYRADGCRKRLKKYPFESLLTKSLHGVLAGACPSTESYGDESIGFLGYCDMGEDHTPILLDHERLVPVEYSGSTTSSLPCHFHTREGLRVTQTGLLSEWVQTALTNAHNSTECEGDEDSQTCAAAGREATAHLYAVPAGRVFMFAPTYVGELFDLPHVAGASDKSIYLEVLSLEPRVFDVFNFFNQEESKELVDRAIAEKSESHRIKRSTTGAGDKAVNSKRTSESGFDTHGKTALKIKRRCFSALGFDEYIDSHGDGLQILRYNVSKAYNSHLDWIDDPTGQLRHNFDSAGTGGNRFATILLYMSDLSEHDGGETVFPRGVPEQIPKEERVTKQQALEELRASERGSILKTGSWEEELTALCRSQLSVRPHSARAVLFYSQHPNGAVDKASLHGACPVLNDQKYAANLWVWNTPRNGFDGAPIKKKFQQGGQATLSSESRKITAVFSNSGEDPSMDRAELFYIDTFWGKLGKGDPKLSVNTFEGHVWNVNVDGKVVKTWTIRETDGPTQSMQL